MKWGKVIEQNIVSEWHRHYISYKALKKIIKKLKEALDNKNNEKFDQLQIEFTDLLHKDLDDVESFYKQREALLLTNFETYENDEACHELYQLEKYAYLNGEGFRKILKKYDKKLSLNTSCEYTNIFKSKTFYYHHQIQQLHASLSNNYEPVICEYHSNFEKQIYNSNSETFRTSLLGDGDCSCDANCSNYSINLYPNYDYTQIINDNNNNNNGMYLFEDKTNNWKQFLLNYFEICHHPKIYIMHILFIGIILLFIVLIIIDMYFSYIIKGNNMDFLSQKIIFKQTQFSAFLFPLLIFSLCAFIALIITCGKSHKTKYKFIKSILIICISPIILTLLFGLSPIIIILLTLILIDIEAKNSLFNSYNVSYEIMFMSQVNNYFYNKLLKQNGELIKNNYYSFNFIGLRILFLSILHLYHIDNDDIKNMYLEIINKFVNNKKQMSLYKCIKYFNKIFLNINNDFYFLHSNTDQQQGSWISLLTSFQSYCILFFGCICFHYILWWISFGWSSYSLFKNFKLFAQLLQFWAIRDAICTILCAIYVWLRHKYMFYIMIYNYSWFHKDLRHLIFDNLISNNTNDNQNTFMRRNMKFKQRFNNENNEHLKFVMEHMMPILRHSNIKKTLINICFDQLWMVDIIMAYSCDFGMYVVPCIERKEIIIKEKEK